MQRFSLKSALAISASAAILTGTMAAPTYAQSADTSVSEDEIVTIGTRRKIFQFSQLSPLKMFKFFVMVRHHNMVLTPLRVLSILS